MGFRFRRTLKLFPGVRLNFSKSGVSVSAGVRGAKVTVSKSGVRQTVGIPGTGLSHTTYTKHGSSSNTSHTYSPSSTESQSSSMSTGWIITFTAFGLLFVASQPVVLPYLIGILVIFFTLRYFYKRTKCKAETKASEIQTVENTAMSLMNVINESLKIANESTDYKTRVQKTEETKRALEELRTFSNENPEVKILRLDGVLKSIFDVEKETRDLYSNSAVIHESKNTY